VLCRQQQHEYVFKPDQMRRNEAFTGLKRADCTSTQQKTGLKGPV
jgi:hypothetical protein